MKVLRCRDTHTDPDCGFVARGATDCEVLDKEAIHVRSAHPAQAGEDRCGVWRTAIQDVPASDTWQLG